MEEQFYNPMPSRLRRRNDRKKISNRAWKKAHERFREQDQEKQWIILSRFYKVEDFYAGLMKNKGHNIRGGCPKSCGMCQPYGLSRRDKKIQYKIKEDLEEFH